MKRLIMVGFAIWLVATIALRIAGQRVLNPDRPWSIIALLAISAILMFRLPRFLLSRLAIPRGQCALGGIALVAPGMFLDTVSAVCFSSAFPNIRPDAAGLFGGWLLFCNVVVLVSAATYELGAIEKAAVRVTGRVHEYSKDLKETFDEDMG